MAETHHTGQARTACYAATFEGSGCLGTIADGVCSAEDDHHPTPGMIPFDGPGAESADTGQARETGADRAARPRRFTPEDALSVAERLGAAAPSGDTVQAPDVAAVLDRLNVAELADDEEQEFNDGQRWMLQKIRHALLGTDTTPDGQPARSPQPGPADPGDRS